MISDYRIYKMDRRERLLCMAEGLLLDFAVAVLFFDSLWAMLPGCLLIFLYFREKQRILMRRRLSGIRKEFQEFLNALITALQTGRSVENAFAEALKDLSEYLETDTVFVCEMKRICAGVSIGESLEKLLLEFAKRSHLEEVEYFAEVFSIGKRSGGNLIGIMKNTIGMLQERMDAEAEIYTILAEKQLEFQIMCVIPVGIIIYLRVTAGNLLDSLYGNPAGILVMTMCLLVYGGCCFYGKRLLELEN